MKEYYLEDYLKVVWVLLLLIVVSVIGYYSYNGNSTSAKTRVSAKAKDSLVLQKTVSLVGIFNKIKTHV